MFFFSVKIFSVAIIYVFFTVSNEWCQLMMQTPSGLSVHLASYYWLVRREAGLLAT